MKAVLADRGDPTRLWLVYANKARAEEDENLRSVCCWKPAACVCTCFAPGQFPHRSRCCYPPHPPAQTPEDVLLRAELEALAEAHPDRFALWLVVDAVPAPQAEPEGSAQHRRWEYSVGRITKARATG